MNEMLTYKEPNDIYLRCIFGPGECECQNRPYYLLWPLTICLFARLAHCLYLINWYPSMCGYSRQDDIAWKLSNDVSNNKRCLHVIELIPVELQVFLPTLILACFYALEGYTDIPETKALLMLT
jgi:hypothetical protein